MAFVTDSNRPPTASATSSNHLPNCCWGRLAGPFRSNATLPHQPIPRLPIPALHGSCAPVITGPKPDIVKGLFEHCARRPSTEQLMPPQREQRDEGGLSGMGGGAAAAVAVGRLTPCGAV